MALKLKDSAPDLSILLRGSILLILYSLLKTMFQTTAIFLQFRLNCLIFLYHYVTLSPNAGDTYDHCFLTAKKCLEVSQTALLKPHHQLKYLLLSACFSRHCHPHRIPIDLCVLDVDLLYFPWEMDEVFKFHGIGK